MKLLFANHIQNAHDSLQANRLRTVLTIVGITIGVASIVAILALGTGASRVVQHQVDELGGNIALIRPGTMDDQGLGRFASGQSHHVFAASTLTEHDVAVVRDLPHVEVAAPIMLISGTIQGESQAPSNAITVATTTELADISQLAVRSGQFFDDTTADSSAVIGAQLSIDLFGTEQSIGRTFTIRGEAHRIIGILERTQNPINYNGIDFDSAAIVSFARGKQLNRETAQIQQINVRTDSVATLGQTIIDINSTLTAQHAGEQDFVVLAGDQIAQPTSQLFFAIAGATATIAGISLLVGGIGIMNIMLVTVAERTREIGIRKAVGATQSDIVWQFLIEALIMSLLGGVIGYACGYLIAFTISLFLTFDPSLSWHVALVAIGLSVIVGIVFGLYPALRAARKDPIESLRQYS